MLGRCNIVLLVYQCIIYLLCTPGAKSQSSSNGSSVPSLLSAHYVISGFSSSNESFSSTTTTVPLDSVQSKDASPLATSCDKPGDDPTRLIKSISDKAKAADIDPTMFMFAQLLSKQSQPAAPTPIPLDKPESLSSAIGKMTKGEDIFVFLHRFEFELSARTIPQHRWITYLPSVLSGFYKEAYYNKVAICTSYDNMKIVLLNIGGYSVSECLNLFSLKFRTGGQKTLLQWYNNWRYKFQIILDSLSFLVNCSD